MLNRGRSAWAGFLLSVALVSGCATVPPARGPAADPLSPHRVRIDGAFYLPAGAVAQALGGQEHWDAETQVWSLTAGDREIRAVPHLPLVLVEGEPWALSRPPRLHNGRLMLPEEVWAKRLARWRLPQAPERPAVSRRLRTLVVDAGHGGKDPGAIGRGGLREKDVVLDIARRLRDLLARDGFRVVMTRYDDRFIPLNGRSAIANRQGADLFLSIHANAARSRRVSGFEAYYLSEATDDHARALAAAENASLPEDVGESVFSGTNAIVWDLLYTEHRAESTWLADQICRGMSRQGLPSQNRGVKAARFAVLKGARMPAVLVEVGFISHPSEEARLRQAAYRQRIAEGIRDGIVKFRDQIERRYVRAR